MSSAQIKKMLAQGTLDASGVSEQDALAAATETEPFAPVTDAAYVWKR